MAEKAILRSNPDESRLEIEMPDGNEYGPLDWPEDDLVTFGDDADPTKQYIVALSDQYPPLKENVIYQLSEVGTVTEEIDDEDYWTDEDQAVEEDEDEEDDEAEEEPANT